MDTCSPKDESFLYKLKSHHFLSDIKLEMMWQKARKAEKASASCYFFLLQHIQSRNQSCHDQTSEAHEATQNQLIFIQKICIFRFMNQAHELQMGKLREMWFEGHQRDPSKVPARAPRLTPGLGWSNLP